jgi:hypothetical protein
VIGPSPLWFHGIVAAVALSGTLLLADGKGDPGEVAFSFADPAIEESSGLVVHGGMVLTVNDSGDGPVVHVVDPSDGETVGRTTYSPDDVDDVEALAAEPDGSVWVGDIGDNGGGRASVTVYRLPPLRPGDRTVEAERFDLRYVDGPTNAETLLVHPVTGRLYVVSKGLLGGRVYAAPERLPTDGVGVLRPVGQVDGTVTDGAFVPDGRHVVLRTYGSAAVLDSRGWQSLGRFGLPNQEQGEGLAVVDGGRSLLLSSEGRRSEVLEVPLPDSLLRAMAPAEEPAPAPASEAPTGSTDASDAPGDEGWSARTWTGVVLLGAVGVALVATVARHLRSRRTPSSL